MRHDFADCTLDTDSLTLTRSGQPVAVEPQVFDLIRLLVENAGRVVTRDEIVETVWQGRIVSESAISARIAAARKAVGDDGKRQAVIRTVARRGLQLVATVAAPSEVAAPPMPIPTPQQRIRYTQSDSGHSLAYTITGSGPPLACAGYLGADLEAEWSIPPERALLDALGQSHSLLRFNYIGAGRSDRSMIRDDFDVMADDLRAAADAAGFDRFALFSQSGGVHVALRFAARHPDRVSRLIVLGGYVQGRSLRRGTDAKSDALRRMIAEGWEDLGGGYGTAFLLTYFPEGPLEEVRGIAQMMQSGTSREAELAIRDAINIVDNAHLLPKIACPVLLIHGRGDTVHPLTEAQKLAAGLADAELLVLDTANHLPVPGHPTWQEFLSAFLSFLAE
jgi:DNA-binding winged helix-turn-helix (wHTH) protein/predicted esterase